MVRLVMDESCPPPADMGGVGALSRGHSMAELATRRAASFIAVPGVPLISPGDDLGTILIDNLESVGHWLTAISFVVLGLTGLNITFGKILLLPLVGPDAISNISQAAKYVHNFTAFSFVVGLILIKGIFFRDNRKGRSRMDQAAGRRFRQKQTCARWTL
jgi:hypothetical protein